jgi:hypothetical protein
MMFGLGDDDTVDEDARYLDMPALSEPRSAIRSTWMTINLEF